jgi:uncharacterized membrane protein
MPQLARPLFILLLVVGAILISVTTHQLPAQIASHFGAGGAPNGWMSRNGYLLFMLAFAVVLPLAVVLGAGVLPRLKVNSINIPNRDYWLDPSRREATLRYLATHACWLGSLLVVFIAAIHLLLIEANATQPPHLPGQLFVTLLVLFVVALAIWMMTMLLHFRRKP